MGLFDFVKNAGDKLFGRDDDADRTQSTTSLRGHLRSHGIDPTGINFRWDRDTVVMEGSVASQDIREKAVLIVGNVDGVERVDDRLSVTAAARTADFSGVTSSSSTVATSNAPGAGASVAHASAGSGSDWASRTYTVKAGDTLSKIAKELYGEAGKYQQIFEANQPMLKDPDKIYPGQVLRIPAER